MKKIKTSNIFAEFGKGLGSFVTDRPDSSTSMTGQSARAAKLRKEAAHIRSAVAKVRELKAQGMTREKALEQARALTQRNGRVGMFGMEFIKQVVPGFSVGEGAAYYRFVNPPKPKNNEVDS